MKINTQEIKNLIQKAEYSIEENTPLCLLGDKYFGFLKREQKTIVICTNNAKKIGGHSITKALQDNGFDKTKIIEIWNKSDLLTNKDLIYFKNISKRKNSTILFSSKKSMGKKNC